MYTDFANQVYNDDVLNVLRNLPDKSVNMIYGDPDYNVGIKYNQKSYTVKFDEYIDWYIELTRESMRVLRDDGNLFMINYPKQNSYLRVKYLDEASYEVYDYVWVYNTNVGHSKRRFTTAHRSVLHALKSSENNFYKDHVAVPYQNLNDKRIQANIANGSKGRMPYSWFYFDLVKNVSKEKTLHACQIPQPLSEMLIKSCTVENDLVCVLFGGSGSEIDVCRRLNRNYVAAELDKKYYEIIQSRIKLGEIKNEYRLKQSPKIVEE